MPNKYVISAVITFSAINVAVGIVPDLRNYLEKTAESWNSTERFLFLIFFDPAYDSAKWALLLMGGAIVSSFKRKR